MRRRAWLRELPAEDVLRRVLLQNYTPHHHRERAGGDRAALDLAS